MLQQRNVERQSSVSAVPTSVWAAAALVVGVVFGAWLPNVPQWYLPVAGIWLIAAALLHRRNSRRMAMGSVLVAITCLGICHWQTTEFRYRQSNLKDLARSGDVTAQLRATIDSVPVVHVRPASKFSPRLYGSPEQTRFEANVTAVRIGDAEYPVKGLCRVYVDGNATGLVSSGDVVRLTGNLDFQGLREIQGNSILNHS